VAEKTGIRKREYNMSLNKEKEISKEESIIVLDSNNGESVVEVHPSVPEASPIVSLSSGEETVKNMLAEEKPNTTSVEDDIVVLYTGGKSNVNEVLPTVSVGTIHNESLESVGSCATVVLNVKCTTGKDSEGKRKKKKKQKRRVRSGRNQGISLNSLYQSPKSWSNNMLHFYNDSWGGETFDVHQLQKSMPDNPSSWYVSYDDIVSRPRRTGPYDRKKCTNCNVWGDATNACPDPPKPVVCIFCGKMGHLNLDAQHQSASVVENLLGYITMAVQSVYFQRLHIGHAVCVIMLVILLLSAQKHGEGIMHRLPAKT
jgi:hypothetical protein